MAPIQQRVYFAISCLKILLFMFFLLFVINNLYIRNSYKVCAKMTMQILSEDVVFLKQYILRCNSFLKEYQPKIVQFCYHI